MGEVIGNLEIKEKSVVVTINPNLYPIDIVLSAAYLFTDNYYVFIDGDPEKEVLVEIRPKNDVEKLEEIGREFNNELINYANYAVQSLRNQEMRKVILDKVTECDFDDPDGIAIPWDEKYGK